MRTAPSPGIDQIRYPTRLVISVAGLAPITHATSDNVQLFVDADQTALLLFNDGFSHWWRPTVNGAAVPLLRASHSRMAIQVSEGHSNVQFKFVPASLTHAAISAVLGMATFCAGALLAARRARVRVSPAPRASMERVLS